VTTPSNDADKDGFDAKIDCDDSNGSVNPDADEVCDGIDNNCDGDVDEDSAVDAPLWYADSDGDGLGDADEWQVSCEAIDGYVSNSDDPEPDCESNDTDVCGVCGGAGPDECGICGGAGPADGFTCSGVAEDNQNNISAGPSVNLVLHSDGTVSAWGYDEFGYGQDAVPAGIADVEMVRAGGAHNTGRRFGLGGRCG